MTSNQLRFWRKVNAAVMAFAMSINWYDAGSGIEGDMPTYNMFPFFEWLYAIENVRNHAFIQISNGIFDEFTISLILRGVSAVLLLIYLAYTLLVLLKKKNEYKSRIVIPLVLMSIFYVFLLGFKSGFLPFTGWYGWMKPMPGFWLISFSLLSSAALEWVNARQVNAD